MQAKPKQKYTGKRGRDAEKKGLVLLAKRAEERDARASTDHGDGNDKAGGKNVYPVQGYGQHGKKNDNHLRLCRNRASLLVLIG